MAVCGLGCLLDPAGAEGAVSTMSSRGVSTLRSERLAVKAKDATDQWCLLRVAIDLTLRLPPCHRRRPAEPRMAAQAGILVQPGWRSPSCRWTRWMPRPPEAKPDLSLSTYPMLTPRSKFRRGLTRCLECLRCGVTRASRHP